MLCMYITCAHYVLETYVEICQDVHDIFSVADDAKMGLVETRIAIIPGGGKF